MRVETVYVVLAPNELVVIIFERVDIVLLLMLATTVLLFLFLVKLANIHLYTVSYKFSGR